MIYKLNFIIKLLISLTLVGYVYFFNYDYKYPLLFLILAYMVGSFLISPLLQHKFLKFFVYTSDLVMLTYFSYATGNIYFLLFYYLLLIPENNLKHILFLSLITMPVVVYNFYQTNFYDFFYVSFVIGVNLFLIKNVYLNKNLNELVSKKISTAQESFLNFLKCKSKSEFYKKYYEVSTTLNLFKKGKISPMFFGKFLYDILNADCIIVYDLEKNDYFKYGCELDYSFITEKLCDDKLYVNNEINKELGFKYIFSKKFGNFCLVIFYKEFILDEDDILNLIMMQ